MLKMVYNQVKKLINKIKKKYEIKYYIIKFMYTHGFFLKLKSSVLRFCNKQKNLFFGHFQVVSTLNNKRTVIYRNFFFLENIGVILFRMLPIQFKYLDPIIRKKDKIILRKSKI